MPCWVTAHTARKRHNCDSCMGTIEPGQNYRRARWAEHGEASVWKAHDYCDEIGCLLMANGIHAESDSGLPALINVCEMDGDDWAIVARENPSLLNHFPEVTATRARDEGDGT